MDFHSAMETFAEAWVAANTQTPLTEAAEAQTQLALYRPSDAPSSSAPHDSLLESNSDGDSDNPRSRSRQSSADNLKQGPSRAMAAETAAKSIPVHCVVEQVPSPQNYEQSCDSSQATVELDSYAIIPTTTLFSDLVRVALVKLGYSQTESIGAKGTIQIKNWKPLSFDTITDNKDANVGQMLSNLTTVATLRIRLYSRPKISSMEDVKEKLLQLLLNQSQGLLLNAGCPIEKSMLSVLIKGGSLCDISEETRCKFDKWFTEQLQSTRMVHHEPHTPPQPAHMNHPHHHHQQQHKTRMRTSFDPELELPKLYQWFSENQHPSRFQIQQYVRELNLLDSRKGRKPLDVNNVVYWFKNARAAFKKGGQRFLEAVSTRMTDDTMCKENENEIIEHPSYSNHHNNGEHSGSFCKSHQDNDSNSGEQSGDSSSEHDCDEKPPEPDPNVSSERIVIKKEPEEECEDLSIKSENHEKQLDNSSHPSLQNGHLPHPCSQAAYLSPNSLLMQSANGALLLEERRKRNRTFIDPVSEIPRLEQWFSHNTHPSHALIEKYTEELNRAEYRQKFPKLEPKNVQFWFKNRRAKCKRLKLTVC